MKKSKQNPRLFTAIVFNMIMLSVLLGRSLAGENQNKCELYAKPKVFGRSVTAFWNGIQGADEIVEVTTKDYEHFLKANSMIVIMYYATWCGYSKRARSKYAELAVKTKASASFKFAAIDCGDQSQLCDERNREITRVPTFIVFTDGKFRTDITLEFAKESPNSLVLLLGTINRVQERAYNKSSSTSTDPRKSETKEDILHPTSCAATLVGRFALCICTYLILALFN